MSLIAELKRRSVFKVGAAYLVVAWIVVQAASIALPAFDAPAAFLRGFILIVLLGFPVALVLAWAFEMTPQGVKVDAAGFGSKRIFMIAAALALLAVGWFLRGIPGGGAAAGDRSIAVLPFVNMSAAPDNEYFADGLSEEILNSLARIGSLQVVGRTSSFQFKGQNLDLREIGAKLGVATVLEGSVRREGDRARITAQLVRVADGFHLWSETYDRTLDDTLAVQLDIAENVAGVLDVVLDDAQRARMREAGVEDVEAFIAYQKGVKLYNEAHDPRASKDLIGDLRLANAEFERAVALEPRYAQALMLAADLYAHEVFSSRPLAEREQALANARRELAQATTGASAPQTKAYVAIDRTLYSDDWHGLAAQFDEIATLDGCAESNWVMMGLGFGYAAKMLDQLEKRIACDPLETGPYQQTILAALWAKQPERALAIVERGDHATGGTPLFRALRSRALLLQGRIDEARAEFGDQPPGTPLAAVTQLMVAAASGESDAALRKRIAGYDRGTWYPDLWSLVDLTGWALNDDRAAANAWAARTDAEPAGPMRIALNLTICTCGMPFDLSRTPNFAARIAESGMQMPTAAPFDFAAWRKKRVAP